VTFSLDQLSARLDNALPAPEAAAIDRALAADPALRASYNALAAADAAARADFAAMLSAPLPLSLARAVGSAPAAAPVPAVPALRPVWTLLAASLACLAIGAGGGWLAARQTTPARDWIADVGDYHAVYAAQTRHLVEVPASEADHIVTWLTAQVGHDAHIPDLTANGLAFQGARLLVADGKPVAQLMYQDAAGQVVALCWIASDKPPTAAATPRTLGAFDALVWGESGARYILIGPRGYPALPAIAETARSA
jgi:anti-sigma factor RsiW